MAVFYAPETAMAKELRKWEYGNPADGYRGYREVVCTEFPKMLYQAGVNDDGRIAIIGSVQVANANEQRNLESRGFYVDQREAIAVAEHRQFHEIPALAAERHYAERFMSDAAQREIAAHETATDAHLATIPETPVRRRPGRPRKKVEVPDAHGHE